MKRIFLLVIIYIFCFQLPYAQEVKKNITEMTKEDVLNLTYDELLEMPFEDVMKLADIVGVSLDELYEMLLNKDVVSASKKVESSFEAPLSTAVISYDEILASGARNIEEALRLVPGMIVREKTNGNFDVHIRGNDNLPSNHMLLYSENSETLVMIDGRPVYNYVHGGTFWETLPVDFDDIDRIEVVRGPASALYGPNAVSGVVNIITKKPTLKNLVVDGNVQGGSQNTLISSLGVSKGIGEKLSFRATGNFETMDRNSDLLYVHEANNGEGGYLTKEQLESLQKYSSLEDSTFFVFDRKDDINAMYPDPYQARDRYGVNGYLFYDINDKIGLDLKGGYQYSEVISTTMGDNASAYTGRISNTSYADLHAKVYGLSAQVNYLGGWQDIVRADSGFKINLMNLNTNLEYDINLGGLNIRPGFAYLLGRYDDSPYLSLTGQEGFLNGEREISSTAFSLRADYLAFKKFRLIGAVRGEKYNTHDKIYWSYQLIGSYNLNNVHNFRVVYSQANRGPFLVDSYANYIWDRDGRPLPGYIAYKGMTNVKLLTSNMLEIGYRVKPVKNIQADFDVFYIKTKNYSALYPDSVNLNIPDRPWVTIAITEIGMTSRQLGVTGNISWVVNRNILLKVFGTVQQTTLHNVIPFSPDSATTDMLIKLYARYLINGTTTYSKDFPDGITDEEVNKSTPLFYGGLVFDAKMFKEKLSLNTNIYFYSPQSFKTKYSENKPDKAEKIDGKVILNVKLSYKVYKDNVTIFVNARNLLGKKQEFVYMDDIGTILLFGLNLHF